VRGGAGSARSASRRSTTREEEALEGLFGRSLEEDLHPRVKEVYEAPTKAFADLDAVCSLLPSFDQTGADLFLLSQRLDALLLELTA
jgi:hypothetical protein